MMRGTKIILMMVIGALPNYLLSHGLDERDKNNADGGSCSALLLIVARE